MHKLQQNVLNMVDVAEKQSLDVISLSKNVISQEIKGLEELSSSLNTNFTDAIESIFQCKGRLVVSGLGKSGHVARKIAATFSSTGTPSIFVHASEASHGDLGMVAENDVVMLLSNSGETAELSSIIDYCKRFAITIIGIARVPNSTLLNASDIPLLLPKTPEASEIAAPTTSTTMMMCLGDAMAVVLHEKRGFTKSEFKVFHPGGNLGAQLLKVDDLMHSGDELPIIHNSQKGSDALLEMTKKRLGCVGVVDSEGRLEGIFTDGDLRRHIEAEFRNVEVKDLMSKNPVTINKGAFASEAMALMNKMNITVLFVLDDTKPIGAIHLHDILRAKVL